MSGIGFGLLAATFTVILCACSWSGDQRDVLNAFQRVSGILEAGEWETAIEEGLDAGTGRFLDSLSEDLSGRGLEGYGSASEVLQVFYREYVDFDGEVTMIFIDGSAAEITVTPIDDGSYSAAAPSQYTMVLEEGEWMMDLSEVFRAGMEADLRGSYIR
ncbi:MAG: hypothetical protein AVO35_05135 [Candidatus Aegiribacteria sp. MLS_C]|nr:MAG: hypothetical protein AVO35_05135 [Candidatus Aegiribacteria sp. MLS_C]